MKLFNVSILNNRTFEAVTEVINLPHRYYFPFIASGSTGSSAVNVCGTYDYIDGVLVLDSVIVDDEKVYYGMDLTYVDTIAIAKQLEQKLASGRAS